MKTIYLILKDSPQNKWLMGYKVGMLFFKNRTWGDSKSFSNGI
jgi:hypothetical protein